MTEKILSDKGTHYFVQRTDYRGNLLDGRRKVQRYPCVGGPLDQMWRSTDEINAEGHRNSYCSMNNGGGCPYSMIFLFTELLP